MIDDDYCISFAREQVRNVGQPRKLQVGILIERRNASVADAHDFSFLVNKLAEYAKCFETPFEAEIGVCVGPTSPWQKRLKNEGF